MTERPFQRILVALDGSRLAEAILPAVIGLAQACGGEIVLLHALEREPPEAVHGEPHLRSMAEAIAYLEALVRALTGLGLAARSVAVAADQRAVADCIAQQAAALETDLVAMTTHGSGGLRGMLFGRIAQQVLQRAERPTLVQRSRRLRREPERPATSLLPTSYRRILVPLSGEPSSARVLPLVWKLADCTGAEVMLARVVPVVGSLTLQESPPTVFLPTASAALLELEEEEARAALDRLAAGARPGTATPVVVRRGETIDELRKLAHQADLVVMGTHGRAGLEGWLSGSTAARLLERVSIPLLLVPAGWLERAG